MKKIIYVSAVLSSLVTGLVYAGNDDNDCGKLNIMITNLTKEPCTLLSAYLFHGYYSYISSVPAFIPPGISAGPIFLEQGLFGPELELTYSCGPNSVVTFTSKQNYCFLWAGDVYGEVERAQNTKADYQAANGSWFWGQHGSINWVLM